VVDQRDLDERAVDFDERDRDAVARSVGLDDDVVALERDGRAYPMRSNFIDGDISVALP
jgi:hypothetical protein